MRDQLRGLIQIFLKITWVQDTAIRRGDKLNIAQHTKNYLDRDGG